MDWKFELTRIDFQPIAWFTSKKMHDFMLQVGQSCKNNFYLFNKYNDPRFSNIILP